MPCPYISRRPTDPQGRSNAVPTCTRPKGECIYEMEYYYKLQKISRLPGFPSRSRHNAKDNALEPISMTA